MLHKESKSLPKNIKDFFQNQTTASLSASLQAATEQQSSSFFSTFYGRSSAVYQHLKTAEIEEDRTSESNIHIRNKTGTWKTRVSDVFWMTRENLAASVTPGAAQSIEFFDRMLISETTEFATEILSSMRSRMLGLDDLYRLDEFVARTGEAAFFKDTSVSLTELLDLGSASTLRYIRLGTRLQDQKFPTSQLLEIVADQLKYSQVVEYLDLGLLLHPEDLQSLLQNPKLTSKSTTRTI